MKSHMEKSVVRGFYWCDKSHWATSNPKYVPTNDIIFGLYASDHEGTVGEMTMEWKVLNRETFPFLKCYNDAFNVLFSFPDLLGKLASMGDKNFTKEEFVQILTECGFKDFTSYTEE